MSEAFISYAYWKLDNIDSANYYAKKAFYNLPNNLIHFRNYAITLSELKDSVELKKPNLEVYTPDNNQDLIKLIKENTMEKDLILVMGAGDINIICANLFLKLINNKSIKNNLAA